MVNSRTQQRSDFQMDFSNLKVPDSKRSVCVMPVLTQPEMESGNVQYCYGQIALDCSKVPSGRNPVVFGHSPIFKWLGPGDIRPKIKWLVMGPNLEEELRNIMGEDVALKMPLLYVNAGSGTHFLSYGTITFRVKEGGKTYTLSTGFLRETSQNPDVDGQHDQTG